MKAVITVVGVDRTGIIAAVSNIMAENQVNILTINQVILDNIFNMAMIVDLENSAVDLNGLQQLLKEKGDQLGVEIRAQNMEIFNAMHRIGQGEEDMLTIHDILETNQMIQKNNLDVRTITMGISLLDCCDSDLETLNQKIYNKKKFILFAKISCVHVNIIV